MLRIVYKCLCAVSVQIVIAACLLAYFTMPSKASPGEYAPDPSAERVVINFNPGGSVRKFTADVAQFNRDGTVVEIRGSCWSACTLYMSVQNVCAHPSASFHFHAPYIPLMNSGEKLYSTIRTANFLAKLPHAVERHIVRRGGLGRDWLHIFGWKTIQHFVKPCEPGALRIAP